MAWERLHPQYWWNPAISNDPYWREIARASYCAGLYAHMRHRDVKGVCA